MNHFKLASTGVRLIAGLLAICGSIGSVWGDPPTTLDTASFKELEDGTLVGLRTAPASATVHYAHQSKLVANDCITLEMRRHYINEEMPALVNHCDYTVAISYCIDNQEAGKGACQAVGHRKIDMQYIGPGAELKLPHAATFAGDEIEWVACRSGDSVVTSLINDGTRGECLSDEPGSPAQQTAAAAAK